MGSVESGGKLSGLAGSELHRTDTLKVKRQPVPKQSTAS